VARDLQEELKQTRAFKSLEEEAHLSIARTAAVLEHAFADALKPYGITPTQYNVLRILRGAGAEGLCRNEVGERLVRRVPDVTRLLDRMEDMKLIVRERGDVDRRYVTTRIAPAGSRVLDRFDSAIEAVHAKQIGHVGRQRLRTLIDLLAVVRNA
jgi:DNA-binding MarR family transcriptional regulator